MNIMQAGIGRRRGAVYLRNVEKKSLRLSAEPAAAGSMDFQAIAGGHIRLKTAVLHLGSPISTDQNLPTALGVRSTR